MRTAQTVTKDPVCGMTINEETSLRVERDGKTFYFCGESYRKTFLSRPSEPAQKGKVGGCCA